MGWAAFERIFLPIFETAYENKEAKASEVPMHIGTENERDAVCLMRLSE
jgi:hypothetical protein